MKAPTSPVFYPLSLHDALPIFKLATLYRAGELTPIYVPTEDNEALRDLVRAREDIKEDELRAKHRLTKFLLRNEINPPQGTRKWTVKYWDWLDSLKFERSASQIGRASCRERV